MSYAESNRVEGEEVIEDTYGHWIIFLPALTASVIFVVLWWIIPNMLRDPEVGGALGLPTYGRWDPMSVKVLLVGLSICAFWLGAAWLRWYASEAAVTNRRVMVKTGLILRNTGEMFLLSIESIHLHQTIWGRILGYGNIAVIGNGDTRTVLRNVPNPQRFRQSIQQQSARLREDMRHG